MAKIEITRTAPFELLNHSDLADMPDTTGTNSDHDVRYYTETEIDTLLSDGTIDHTNLSNIGVNTHAQIDTHIASTANPHAVTASQVIDSYDTGWINRSDWTNVHIGSNTGLNVDSQVVHNLNAPLSDLLVQLIVDGDGNDTNSILANTGIVWEGVGYFGLHITGVTNNTLEIQTGAGGIMLLSGAGVVVALNNQNWYYKVKVYKLT